MTAEYKDEYGFYIISLSDGRYYYGDGITVNSFGISANQFLRFHPYMQHISGTGEKPSQQVTDWITNNT